MNTQVNRPKTMRWAVIGFTLLFLTVFLVPITLAADVTGTQLKEMSHNESPVMKAEETASFGTEDFIVTSETTSFGTEDFIVTSETTSFGTEDWVLASETVSFGAEDWTGTMEFSGALGTGTIPEPAPEELNLDDYNPD